MGLLQLALMAIYQVIKRQVQGTSFSTAQLCTVHKMQLKYLIKAPKHNYQQLMLPAIFGYYSIIIFTIPINISFLIINS